MVWRKKIIYNIWFKIYVGTPFSALAFYIAKNGLETTICHENQSLFKNEQTIIDNNESNLVMDEYKE